MNNYKNIHKWKIKNEKHIYKKTQKNKEIYKCGNVNKKIMEIFLNILESYIKEETLNNCNKILLKIFNKHYTKNINKTQSVIINSTLEDMFKLYENENTIDFSKNQSKIYYKNNSLKIKTDNFVNTSNVKLCLNLSDGAFVTNKAMFSTTHKLDLCGCVNFNNLNKLSSVNTLILGRNYNAQFMSRSIDISMLYSVKILTISNVKLKINNVGNLRELEELTINRDIEGIDMLINLKKLIIHEYHSKKMKQEIKKLQKINPNVKIYLF